MASRQEEKEARRKARLEQEAAEQRSASRNKRLQLMFGAVLGAGIIAAVVIALLASGGKSSETEAKSPPKTAASSGPDAIPVADLTDMNAAAKAAGCTLANPADEGNNHVNKVFHESDYKTNPPTSGAHFPEWAQDGIYEPGKEPQLGMLVHTLEHGRIDVQYKPGTPKRTVKRLETLLGELDSGYHMLLFQNPTGMKYEVAATTWDHSLTCPKMNDHVFDAIRTFRQKYIDKGPEKVA